MLANAAIDFSNSVLTLPVFASSSERPRRPSYKMLLTYNENNVQYYRRMKANPGGTIGLTEIVGRDILVQRLWRILEGQSLVLTSERRIGKTCVIRKMKEERPDPNIVCVLRDIEELRSPQEFVEALYADVEALLPTADRARLKFQQLLSKLGGFEVHDLKIPQLTPHWKNLLFALTQDLFDSPERRVVFFWDELPYFIHEVSKSSGEATAMEMLDALRSLRQRHSRLRMVFTGSVGLHLVVKALRRGNYVNDPTNDMQIREVWPLDEPDGISLARQLIEGEGIELSASVALARAVSEAAGHIPYYIHCLVARMTDSKVPVTESSVVEHLNSLICDLNDPARFRHYRERLDVYYSPEEKAIALAALDALAFAGEPKTFDDLLNLIRHELPEATLESVRDTLSLLAKDHYISRPAGARGYGFRYAIVRQWWMSERG